MARKLLVMVLCMFFLYISGDTVGIFIQALQQDQQAATAGSQTNTVENSGLQGKLVFAHVLYRHGDRTPLDPYPNDPWNKREFWPTGWGQLTNTGKQQHYELGQWLRQRYGSLIGAQYDRNDIYIRSTDVDRTLMSAESNLAGLYEPVNDDVWNKDIKWQPIPIHTVPEQYDYVLAAKRSCAAYDFARSELDTSPEFIKLYDRYNYLFKYLTEYSGRNVESFEQICYLNNTLFIESLYNLALPEWTKKVYPSPDMTFAADFAFVIPTYTRKMARLKSGPLMKEIFDRFSEKAKGTLNPDRALWVYSAHDTTVANVLNTLKLFDPHCPPYAATILMELRLDDNQQPFVSFFYKNTTAEPAPLYIPDCGTECPLDKLYKIYDDILPRDWEQECKLSTMMMTYDQANIGLASGILIAILLTTLVLSYVLMIYYRRRSYRTYLAYTQVA